MTFTTAFDLLRDTYHEWSEDKVPRLGAALACYTVFSLAPLLVILLAVAGLLFGPSAADQLTTEIGNTVGRPVGEAVGAMLKQGSQPATGGWAAVIGTITLLFTASGVFGALQDALNTIWKVQPRPGRGLWGLLRDRFLSLSMVLGVCFLLLVSLAVTAALAALTRFWTPSSEGAASYLIDALNEAVAFGVVTVLFALVYKFLPDAEVRWADVWLGAALTALLFVVGKYLLGAYLATASVTSGYGAAGSLVLIVLWVYYSSQLVLFGAEFTRVYAQKFGEGIKPAADAVAMTAEAQARQGILPAAR
jgi:membrane protein